MNRLKSIIALILAAMLLLGLMAYIVLPSAFAEEDLNDELSSLQQERKKLEKQLNQVEDKIDSEMDKKSIIDQQINNIRSTIAVEQKKLDQINAQLEDANDKLKEATQAYNEAFEDSKDRIRASYENGTASYLQIILSSDSIADFITRLEIVKEIMAYDNALLKNLNESRQTIETSQKTILDKQQEQQKTTDSLNEQNQSLKLKQANSDRLVEQFNSRSDELTAQIEEVERQEADLRKEIQKMLAQEGTQNTTSKIEVSGEFMYPLDSKWKMISDPFGYRYHPITGIYKLHTGCDFTGSGIYGANIYASKNGTVTTAGHHRAYGNYVVINHGDGTATLYAHMDRIATSTGAVVSQGQVIGYVGSSGYSTGAHLHFEIMRNGDYEDPVPHFSSNINFVYI